MIDLPGHLTGVIGEMGAGKSLIALKIGLALAHEMGWRLQTNFALDALALQKYCLKMHYLDLYLDLRDRGGRILVKPVADSLGKARLEKWMDQPYTIYLLDEAGIFLNSRRFSSTPPQFLADLAQIRHDSRRLLWIAQYMDQVDRQLRELTQSYVHCDSVVRYSKKLRNTELFLLRYTVFLSKNYKIYASKVLDKSLGLKSFFQGNRLAHKSFIGRPSAIDLMLFDCYPSLERIENDPDLIYPSSPSQRRRGKVLDFIQYKENRENYA